VIILWAENYELDINIYTQRSSLSIVFSCDMSDCVCVRVRVGGLGGGQNFIKMNFLLCMFMIEYGHSPTDLSKVFYCAQKKNCKNIMFHVITSRTIFVNNESVICVLYNILIFYAAKAKLFLT
jgi:hypothetical protein